MDGNKHMAGNAWQQLCAGMLRGNLKVDSKRFVSPVSYPQLRC